MNFMKRNSLMLRHTFIELNSKIVKREWISYAVTIFIRLLCIAWRDNAQRDTIFMLRQFCLRGNPAANV